MTKTFEARVFYRGEWIAVRAVAAELLSQAWDPTVVFDSIHEYDAVVLADQLALAVQQGRYDFLPHDTMEYPRVVLDARDVLLWLRTALG